MLALRRAIAPGVRESAAGEVALRVAALPEFAACARVVLYAAVAGELPTRPVYERARRAHKPLLWPRVCEGGAIEFARCDDWDALQPDAVGIPAPPPAAPALRLGASDLLLVPGVAFTARGARLGRGAAHYDRLLAARVGETRVGIAFDEQIVPAIPEEAHDQPVDLVVTPTKIWRSARWPT